jgi:aspartyl-tRNA(Asn)/glutamyl-tRNA(Gln) amidotransferase subunit A
MVPFLHEAVESIRAGGLSPIELVQQCLDNIERHESRVRAWVLIDRDGARREAQRLRDEARQRRWRGPLHGIPIGIKDIIDVAGWPTAAGSRQWANRIATRDADVVVRLRNAGAIILGKTITTPYASFDVPPTRNPWDTKRTPGGSSSGSAAAVACGMCLGALGSQTGGSLTRPASYCGIAAYKPTYGSVSVNGVLPLAPSMDHVGPMAQSARDLAILLAVIDGSSAVNVALSEVTAGRSEPTAPRLGRVRGLFEDLAEPAVLACMDMVSERFQAHGAAITEVVLPALFVDVLQRHRLVMAVEAAAYHEDRLRHLPEEYGPKITALLEEGLDYSAPEYVRARDHQKRLIAEMIACFGGVDALLTPATTGPAPVADTTGDPAFNSPWSYTGLPTVSLPAAWTPEGLPLAIQLVGKESSEGELLATAAWCEKSVNFRRREPC